MTALDRAERYLAIPARYGAELGGLWWSSRRDAVERRDGTTLAVTDEVRAVLDGALAHPAAPAFAFVLNVLHLMKAGGGQAFDPLRRAYAGTRGVAARGRNVGLLIAELCRLLPWVPGSIKMEDVAGALRALRLYGPHTRGESVEEPPHTRTEFEKHLAHRLAYYDEAALVHWLTHGRGPGEGGSRIAEQAESLPERVARLLARARLRTRLVGAASLVPALDAALTLPPRGRPPDALPLGGYCDVTTRGDPERLLPGQFALDPDEFVRRFAASELLYFKREEPHEAVRPERVIVLDQGVRTWGSVRLALAGAALALLRVNPKRCGPVHLFATSAPGAVELLHPNPDAVAERLEASDLTPHPGDCLRRALRAGEGEPRDVILLTHPRNVNEADVASAAAERGANDRLFAVTVDEAGRAELAQWSAGGALALRSFRVDLEAAEAARPDGEGPPRPAPSHAPPPPLWGGDVEPLPFPFRPGLVGDPLHFGFAADGGWLVSAGREGRLHGLAFDGTPPEVLPRPYRNGVVLKQVDAVLGVTGGAVVCGRMAVGGATVAAPAPQSVTLHVPYAPVTSSGASEPTPVVEQFVAAHYDRATRHVALHLLGPTAGTAPQWSAHPDIHCIAVRGAGGTGCALDLGTLGRYPVPAQPVSTVISRACLAWDHSAAGTPPFDVSVLPVAVPPGDNPLGGPTLHRSGVDALRLMKTHRDWHPLAPQRDGKPLLVNAQVYHAQLAGDVLALTYADAGERNLLLLRGPDGAVLGEVRHPVRNAFGLSADGSLFARYDATHAIVVAETAAPARPVATGTHAALHSALELELTGAPFGLTIVIGGHRHSFRVEAGALLYKSRWEITARTERPKVSAPHPPTSYDPARFPPREGASAAGWRADIDRMGQVLLFREGGPLVAAFLIRRERAAVWIPGGVFWGDPRLIGGSATPDADKKIGQAITDAGGR